MTDPFARLLQNEVNKPKDPFDRAMQQATSAVNPATGAYKDPEPEIFGEGDSSLPSLLGRIAKFPLELGKGFLESINVAPEIFGGKPISTRQRLARTANILTLPLPLAAPFKVAKTASIATKALAAAAGSAVQGGAIAAVEGVPIMPRAAGASLVGAGLETGLAMLSRGRIRLGSAASKIKFADEAKFTDPVENPFFTTKDWAITSPMLTKTERRLSSEANITRYGEAKAELANYGRDITEIDGYKPRSKKPDAAFLLHGTSLSEAVEAAQRWGQDWVISPEGYLDLKSNTIRPIKGIRFNGEVLPKDPSIEILVNGKKHRVAFDFGSPEAINPVAIGKSSRYVQHSPDEQAFALEPSVSGKIRQIISQRIRNVYGAEYFENFIKARETGDFPLPSEVARQDFTGLSEVATSYDGVYSILDRNFKHFDKSLKDIVVNNLTGNELETFDDYLVALRKIEIDNQINKQGQIIEETKLANLQKAWAKRLNNPPKNKQAHRQLLAEYKAEQDNIKLSRQQWEESKRLDPAHREELDNFIKDTDNTFGHFADTADQVHQWREAQLEWLYEADILTKPEVDFIKLNAGKYVPLREVENKSIDSIIDELKDSSLLGSNFAVGPNQQLDLLKKKLDLSKVDSPLGRLVQETGDLTRAVKRGQVGATLVKWLDSVGPEISQMFAKPVRRAAVDNFPAVSEVIENLRTPLTAGRNNLVISGVVNGNERVWYEITDPAIAEMFYAMNPAEIGVYTKLFGSVATLLRNMATLAPEFLAKNWARDVVYGKVTSNAPLKNFITSLSSAFTKDASFQEALRAGAFKSEFISNEVQMGRATVQEWLGQTGGKKELVKNVIKTPIDAIQAVSLSLERATRLGQYKKAFEEASKTMPPEQAIRYAALAARDVSVDFGMYGSRTAPIRLTTAFWNAQIQGYYRLQEAFKTDPVGFTKRAIGYITVPSVLFYLINRKDPDYFNLPQWERTMFWHTKIGDQWIRFPKPFELGVFFGSSVERMLEMLDKHDPTQLDEFSKNYAKQISFDLLPIPTAARPFIENWKNESFLRGRPIVSKALEDVEKRYQVQPGTSALAIAFAHYWDVSPVQVDNIIRGYTAGSGQAIGEFLNRGRDISDALFDADKKISDALPSFNPKDTWGLRAFTSQFPRNAETIDKLYDFADKARKASATSDYLEKSLRIDDLTDYIERRAVLAGIGDNLQPALTALAQLRAERGRIMLNNSLSPAEKRRQFDALDKQMYEISNTVYNAVKQFDMENK